MKQHENGKQLSQILRTLRTTSAFNSGRRNRVTLDLKRKANEKSANEEIFKDPVKYRKELKTVLLFSQELPLILYF